MERQPPEIRNRKKPGTMKPEITTGYIQSQIAKRIETLKSVGYNQAEAEQMMNRALALVAEGKKAITDIIEF